jgi:hypothetical protein
LIRIVKAERKIEADKIKEAEKKQLKQEDYDS